MSIVKKILASVAAMTMVVSSFAALSAFADGEPTIKATLMTNDELVENFSVAEAGAGVNITFENFEKNVGDIMFTLSIPDDLKLEHNAGTSKKPKWEIADVSESTIGEAVLWDDGEFQYILDAGTSNGFKKYSFIAGAVGAPKTTTISIYFATESGSYTVGSGAFDLSNVQVVYDGDNSPISNLKVVQATNAAPTTYAVTTAATENGTVAVDKETASEGETVTITTTPSEGYEVATVTAGGAEVTGADNTYTFTMPAKAVEVAVTFKAKTVVDTNAAEKLTGDFTNGANDNAVAFKKTFDANSLTGKTLMKLTAIVDGVARVYKGAPVAIPNVDGELKLGVVIQYKDVDVNVESLAIELLD